MEKKCFRANFFFLKWATSAFSSNKINAEIWFKWKISLLLNPYIL